MPVSKALHTNATQLRPHPTPQGDTLRKQLQQYSLSELHAATGIARSTWSLRRREPETTTFRELVTLHAVGLINFHLQ